MSLLQKVARASWSLPLFVLRLLKSRGTPARLGTFHVDTGMCHFNHQVCQNMLVVHWNGYSQARVQWRNLQGATLWGVEHARSRGDCTNTCTNHSTPILPQIVLRDGTRQAVSPFTMEYTGFFCWCAQRRRRNGRQRVEGCSTSRKLVPWDLMFCKTWHLSLRGVSLVARCHFPTATMRCFVVT